MDNYHIYEEIGRGRHCVVYRGRKKKTIEYVAIKCVEKGQMSNVLNEVQIMHRLKSTHAITFHTWYETSKHVWLILEYCTGSDLATLLQQDLVMPESAVKILGTDLMAGLHYLHVHSVLFCDLKPSNVLVDEFGVPKLASFTLSRRIPSSTADESGGGGATDDASKPTSRRPGTPCYMAPELFMAGGTPSFASDAWSLGCVLFELATGRPPFVDSSLQRLMHQIMCDDPPLPAATSADDLARGRKSGLSANFIDLLRALLHKNPEKRLCWPRLREHSFWEGSLIPVAAPLPPQPLYEAHLAQRHREASDAERAREVGPLFQHSAASPDPDLLKARTPASAPVAPHPHARSSFMHASGDHASGDQAAVARSDAMPRHATAMPTDSESMAPETPVPAGDAAPDDAHDAPGIDGSAVKADLLRLSLNARRNLEMRQQHPDGVSGLSNAHDQTSLAISDSARVADHGDVQLENPDAEVDFGNASFEDEMAAGVLPSPQAVDRREESIVESIAAEDTEAEAVAADDSLAAAEVEDEVEAEGVAANSSADMVLPLSTGAAPSAPIPSSAQALGASIQLRASMGDYAALELDFVGSSRKGKHGGASSAASMEAPPEVPPPTVANSTRSTESAPSAAWVLLLRSELDGFRGAEPALEAVLFGSIAPVVFNAAIDPRCVGAPKHRAAALPFSAPSPAEVAQLPQEGLEQFLGMMYRALAAAAPAAQKANIASYTHALAAASPKLANLLVNSSFVTLLAKLARRCRSDALRARLVLLIGDLVRHATYVLPDSDGQTTTASASTNTMLGCLTDLLSHEAAAGRRSPAELGSEKSDADMVARVRRRAMAALGELLFYISSTQVAAAISQSIKGDAASTPQWHIPSETVAAVLSCLRAGGDRLDETLRHCAVRTLQNIFAQAASSATAAATARLVASQRAAPGQAPGAEVSELNFIHVERFLEAGVGARFLSIVRDAPGSSASAKGLRASAAAAFAALARLIVALGILEQPQAAQAPGGPPVVAASRLAQLAMSLTQGPATGEFAHTSDATPSADALADALCDGLVDDDPRVCQSFLLILHTLLLPMAGLKSTVASAPEGIVRVWRAIAARLPVLLPSLVSLVSRSASPSAATVDGPSSDHESATSLCKPFRTVAMLVLSQLFDNSLQYVCDGGMAGDKQIAGDLSPLTLILSCCAGGAVGRNGRELSLIRVVSRLGQHILAAGDALLGTVPTGVQISCVHRLSRLETVLAEARAAGSGGGGRSASSPKTPRGDAAQLAVPLMHMAVRALNLLIDAMLQNATDVVCALASEAGGEADGQARFDGLLLPLYLIEDGGSSGTDACELGFRYQLVNPPFINALAQVLSSAARLGASWPDPKAPSGDPAQDLLPQSPSAPDQQALAPHIAARAGSPVPLSASPGLADHRRRPRGLAISPHRSPDSEPAVVPSPRCPSPWFGRSSAREVAAACDAPSALGSAVGPSRRGPLILLLLEAVQCHLLHGVSDVCTDVEHASLAMEGALEEAALSLAAAREVQSRKEGREAVRRLPTNTASRAASCATRAAKAAQSLQAAHVVRSKWAWQLSPAFVRDVVPALASVCRDAPSDEACAHGLRMIVDVVANFGNAVTAVADADHRGGTVAHWVQVAGESLNDALRTVLGQDEGLLPCLSGLLERDATAIKQLLLQFLSEVMERWPDLLRCSFATAADGGALSTQFANLLGATFQTIASGEQGLQALDDKTAAAEIHPSPSEASMYLPLISSSWRLLRAVLHACESKDLRVLVCGCLLGHIAGFGRNARSCILRSVAKEHPQDLSCALHVLEATHVILAEVAAARRESEATGAAPPAQPAGGAAATFEQAGVLLAPLLDAQTMRAIATLAALEAGGTGPVAGASTDAEWHGQGCLQPAGDARRRIADAAAGVLLASGLVFGASWSSMLLESSQTSEPSLLALITPALASREGSVGATSRAFLLRAIRCVGEASNYAQLDAVNANTFLLIHDCLFSVACMFAAVTFRNRLALKGSAQHGRGQHAASAICGTCGLLDALQALADGPSDGSEATEAQREVATMAASISKSASLLLREQSS